MAEHSDREFSQVVSDVTVKALQEFELEGDVSRPPSGKGSKPQSAEKSARGSRPATGSTIGSSRPGSAIVRSPSRPGSGRPESANKDRPSSGRSGKSSPQETHSKPASRPSSGAQKSKTPSSVRGSRPNSANHGSRPSSADKGLDIVGSRPGSATNNVEPELSSRPGSASGHHKTSSRPGSTRGSQRTPSGSRSAARSHQPFSAKASRPASADKDSDPADGEWAVDGQGAEERGGVTSPDSVPQAPVPEGGALVEDTYQMMITQGDGAGSSDDDDDDDEEEELIDDEDDDDAEMDETDDSDREQEMVVLDPDHPLMARFQTALKKHLEKQHEKVTLALRELEQTVNKRKTERENLGVELYGVQQELARHQMLLEKNHDDYSNVKQDRNTTEQLLLEVREMYKDKQFKVNTERKKGSELQTQVENLALRLLYVENAKEDVRSDISVMRRAAEKADMEVSKAELMKQKQDLYVDRLVERMDKLREEISMHEAQTIAQGQETKSTKEALTEAHMEIESINLEKKQLFQQWNSSLIGMRRRDEARSAMQEALNQQQQRILSLETEIEGYKKSIGKEQEQNEKLTLVLNKTEIDIQMVKKMLQIAQDKHDALKNEYATYTRMLHETEQALNRANTDKALRLNEVNALQKQIEREYLEKVKLEDEVLEKMRSQLTLDKSSKYTDKLTKKIRARSKELEAQSAQVENDISRDTLEVSNVFTRIERLIKTLDTLDEEIAKKNDIISRSEAEITKRNAIIERKQGVIDQYNKKLEHMITSAGGVELGPLEIQINSLQKSIEAEQNEIADLQQMWLRDQSELVRLTKEKYTQSQDVENLKKQLTILSQKKLRLEGEINQENVDIGDIERSISHMQNDMIKLNKLLHKEKGIEVDLSQNNILMENDFIGSLREAEHESIEMQESLDKLKEEKERLLNSLVEAERQIMLWEKKTQLARETRAAVDSEIGQGEVKAMKAEIHRMQVRYSQLMKQQERMMQEMEKAVSRRDTIVTRGDAQSKASHASKQVLTKGIFQRQLAELKKKIKTTAQDANNSDMEIRELRDNQQELSTQLEEKQLAVQQLQGASDTLDGDLDRSVEQKHKNMQDLLERQQKTKHYQQVKDDKYTRICKSDAALDQELEKQVNRMQTLHAIVDRLTKDFPQAQPALHKVSLSLEARASSIE